jgi:hypothetical protein
MWRAVWREAAGAWRSLRFDLRLRANRRDATGELPAADDGNSPYEAFARRPRRALGAVTVAVLVVAGVAGTYFAVVGGLSVLVAGDEPPPGALPAVSRDAAPAARPPLATGRGPVTPVTPGSPAPGRSAPAAAPVEPPPAPEVSAAPPVPGQPGVGRSRGGVPVPTPAPPCACQYPPSPPPSASPDPTPAPAPSPAPSPSPSPSPAPTPTVEPSEPPPGDPGS